ncbi:helix-turn-helix domain-containing protein [Sphingobium sp. SJ10-10]|uniref:helix-turn-helix domain-containing protein n=1 Tax=Sphingobium sp. SJ10-10 TaxID=3114999 RepID=UPI002E16E0ED|nr:helix-turn-helix domain-containing protein [Sphingobium sp. SJ10-10]
MRTTMEDRRSLYEQGLNDCQIARRIGVDKSAVRQWRKRNGLAPNLPSSAPGEVDLIPMRKLLFDLGWGVARVARHQGVSKASVSTWKARQRLNTGGPQHSSNSSRDDGNELRRLQRRIIKAVGGRLPFDIAADAAASLMLDVIEGKVPVQQIERVARRYGNKALGEYADAFKSQSLDVDVRGAEGLRPIDMLVDESSSAWLEEMGATWH